MYVPINAVTGKPYQGKNAEALSEAAVELNTEDSRWATFLQIKSLGPNIYLKKGSKGTKILVFKEFKQENGTELFYKHYTVFNAVQIENMPAAVATIAPTVPTTISEDAGGEEASEETLSAVS